jgi:hypothetical protein
MIEEITFVIVLGTLVFTIVKTWLTWEMLHESRNYWASWKERSKDVADKVLKDIPSEVLMHELEKRKKAAKSGKRDKGSI